MTKHLAEATEETGAGQAQDAGAPILEEKVAHLEGLSPAGQELMVQVIHISADQKAAFSVVGGH